MGQGEAKLAGVLNRSKDSTCFTPNASMGCLGVLVTAIHMIPTF